MKQLHRLSFQDFSKILKWMFLYTKRPTFMYLKARDRPKVLNFITVESGANLSDYFKMKFGTVENVKINEKVTLDCVSAYMLKEVDYTLLVPSLSCITPSNIQFLHTIELKHLFDTSIFIDSTPELVDFSGFKRFTKLGSHFLLSLDCEMATTTEGKEVGRVTLVTADGHTLYDKIVKPTNTILNYETQYSGLTKEIVDRGIAFDQVQTELCNLVGYDTMLLGHGIENDLAALKFWHDKIIDTSYLFLNPEGRRVSLAQLGKKHLDLEIHNSKHSSEEDALVCLKLAAYKIQEIATIKAGPYINYAKIHRVFIEEYGDNLQSSIQMNCQSKLNGQEKSIKEQNIECLDYAHETSTDKCTSIIENKVKNVSYKSFHELNEESKAMVGINLLNLNLKALNDLAKSCKKNRRTLYMFAYEHNGIVHLCF